MRPFILKEYNFIYPVSVDSVAEKTGEHRKRRKGKRHEWKSYNIYF